jgi:hypothetical protein
MPKIPRQNKKTGARKHNKNRSRFRPTYSGGSRTAPSINELLTRNSIVGRVIHKVAAQQSWVAWLRESLPAELAAHVVHAVPKQSELVVFADTPSWCARLRYAMATMEEPIRERDPAIRRTYVRVQPSYRVQPS